MAQNQKKVNRIRSYLDEIYEIYEAICKLEHNSYRELIQLKKRFLEFNEKAQYFKIFKGGLNEKEITFLKNEKFEKFSEEHINLEELIRFYLTYTIAPGLMARKTEKESYLSNIEFSTLTFAQKYGEIKSLAYNPESGEPVVIGKRTYDQDELMNLLSEKGKIQKSLKEKRLRDRKLLRRERVYVEEAVLPYLEIYRKTIEETFFDIKDHFRWYNKDVRIYIGNFLERDAYEIIAKTYPSDKFSFSIFPLELAIYPHLDCNFEEIPLEATFIIFTFLDKPKHPKAKPRNVFGITNFTPFEEVLEIFWLVASYQDKLRIMEKIFLLLGYRLKQDKNSQFYKIFKSKFDLFTSEINKEEGESSLIVFPQKSYLSESDAKDYVGRLKSKKAKNKFIIASFSSPTEELIRKYNTEIISLRKIAKILYDLNLFQFLNTFLLTSILKKDNRSIQNALYIQDKGKKLKEELVSLDNSKEWRKFEKFVEKLFEFLFKDSFKNYYAKPQFEEYGGHRRADLVISNINPIHDFWKHRKKEESAKRIVVDAKYYQSKITSKAIFEVSKYLHEKKGNFAIIVTLKGVEESGITEQRLRYYDYNQLILILDSVDIIEMINYRINNQMVEEILDRKLSLIL